MHGYVSDTLTRKGQILTVGCNHDAVPVALEYVRHLNSIVSNFSVRFIRNKIYGFAQLRFLLGQYFPQVIQNLFAIDHTGGVVGGIYQYRLGHGTDGIGQGAEIWLKVGARRQFNRFSRVIVYVKLIFHKKRFKYNNLFPFIQKGF